MRGKPKVGFVTIGQSPRTDIMANISPLLVGFEVLEAGALDAITDPTSLAPAPGEKVLVSRLRDGTQVKLGEGKVIPLVYEAVESIIRQGARLVVLLCTGTFPRWELPVPVLYPGPLLYHFTAALANPETKLAVFIPAPEQEEEARKRWGKLVNDVQVISLSPYINFVDFVAGLRQTEGLAERELIVMDCLGYGSQHKRAVRHIAPCPVLLPRTLVARVVHELI